MIGQGRDMSIKTIFWRKKKSPTEKGDYAFYAFFVLLLGFTLWKAEQPLQGTEIQEKEAQKD